MVHYLQYSETRSTAPASVSCCHSPMNNAIQMPRSFKRHDILVLFTYSLAGYRTARTPDHQSLIYLPGVSITTGVYERSFAAGLTRSNYTRYPLYHIALAEPSQRSERVLLN